MGLASSADGSPGSVIWELHALALRGNFAVLEAIMQQYTRQYKHSDVAVAGNFNLKLCCLSVIIHKQKQKNKKAKATSNRNFKTPPPVIWPSTSHISRAINNPQQEQQKQERGNTTHTKLDCEFKFKELEFDNAISLMKVLKFHTAHCSIEPSRRGLESTKAGWSLVASCSPRAPGAKAGSQS